MSRFSFSIKKVALAFAAAAVATVGLTAVSPGAAQAAGFTVRFAPVSNPFVFVSVRAASTQPGADIIQWSLAGTEQKWKFRPAGVDAYEIVNRWSGQCITTDGVAGHTLFQWTCDGSAGQLWSTSIVPGNLIGYSIRNPGSNLFMDVVGGSGSQGALLDAWYWNGGNNQYFTASLA